jgi:ribosomal protein L7Ae-like RNA K-turn-binding protein
MEDAEDILNDVQSQLRVAKRAVEGAEEVVKAVKRLGLFDSYV